MNRCSVHYSSAHDLYYVIETEPSGRGRVVYAHAWRMCAQYVAERQQSLLSQGEGAGSCPDIQTITALTKRNALFPSPAIHSSRSRAFPQSVQSHFGWCVLLVRRFRRRIARLLRHSLREHDPRPGRDPRPLVDTGC